MVWRSDRVLAGTVRGAVVLTVVLGGMALFGGPLWEEWWQLIVLVVIGAAFAVWFAWVLPGLFWDEWFGGEDGP